MYLWSIGGTARKQIGRELGVKVEEYRSCSALEIHQLKDLFLIVFFFKRENGKDFGFVFDCRF